MSGFYFGEDVDDDQVPRDFASAPSTGFIPNFQASRKATLAAGRTDSREVSLRDAYDPVVDALNAGFRKAGGLTLISPDAERMFRNPYRGRAPNAALDAVGGLPAEEKRIWGEITRRRKSDPRFLTDLGPSPFDFRRKVDERARQSLVAEAEAADTATMAGTIGGFIGSMAGGFTDAPNIAAMALGGGPARSVLAAALREATINAGVEAATLPFIAKRRSDIGAPITIEDAAISVGAAGVLGGVVGAGASAIGKGAARFRKLPEAMSETELIDAIGSLGELPREVHAARTVLAEKLEIDALNPR